jgi:uncharacterized protein YkwD
MRTVIRMAGLVFLALSFFLPAQAQTSASPAERQLFVSVNRARQAQGLPTLKWDEALATAARRHAGMMAQRGAAEHVFPGEPSLPSRATKAGAHFASLSENVIMGSDIGLIEAEFLKSPNHRANILDTDMDSIGVGVILRAGQLFAVEDFSKAK